MLLSQTGICGRWVDGGYAIHSTKVNEHQISALVLGNVMHDSDDHQQESDD